MAASQDDNVPQQQPEQAPVHGSEAQASSTERTPARRRSASKPVAQSPQGAAGEEAQGVDAGLGQALEQQITQAIQPALDEFRQRMEGMSKEMAARPRRGAGQSDTGQKAPQEPDTQRPTAPAQQSPTHQAPEPSAAPEAAPQQREDEESQPEPPLIPVRHLKHATERPLAGALTSAVQTVGRSSAQWLQSLLVAGLGALLAGATHEAIHQRAEQGLHTLLQKAFEAAPAAFANQEMLEKTERTLQLILREALEAVFAEGVRASLQQGGQQTIQQSLHGDFGGAVRKGEETLQVMVAALITVLRRHQQTILRLLLALALLAVASSLEQSADGKHSDDGKQSDDGKRAATSKQAKE